MTKLLGFIFVVVFTCIPGIAQELNKASIEDTKTGQAFPPKPLVESPKIQFKTEDQRRLQESLPAAGSLTAELKWVVKDGLVYLDLVGTGTLIPVPGGGASGCFDLNLKERLSKLRTTIQAFPPK